jgi:hypothetical protein
MQHKFEDVNLTNERWNQMTPGTHITHIFQNMETTSGEVL